MRGFFITFEGGEGSGKTTQIDLMADRLRAAGHEVVVTREPGGTPGADVVRQLVLSGAVEDLGSDVEAFLFSAARIDHLRQVIMPALEAGHVVLCDRFHLSTRVYQSSEDAQDGRFLGALERVTLGGVYPDLTIVLDLDPEEGARRAANRRGDGQPDRFEKDDIETQAGRRNAFLKLARLEPDRCAVIDAERETEVIADDIAALVEDRIQARLIDGVRERLSESGEGAVMKAQ